MLGVGRSTLGVESLQFPAAPPSKTYTTKAYALNLKFSNTIANFQV
jgi:hypothetical protein